MQQNHAKELTTSYNNEKVLFSLFDRIYNFIKYINIFFVILLISIAIFGCAKLPTESSLAQKTHIPTKFHNTLSDLSNKDSKKVKLDYKQTFFTLFQDKTLQDLIQRALDSNTNLLTLESQIKQARATAKINTANLFPKINTGVNYNYSDNNYKKIQTTITQNTTNASLSFSWEADIFGKLNALRLASKQQILQSLQDLNQAQVVLIGDLANYYFTIRQTQQAIIINEEITKNLEQIYHLTEEKYNLGLIGLDSLATAKSNYLSQKNATLSLRYTLEQNKNALLVLLNSNDLGFDSNDLSYHFAMPQIPNIATMPINVIFNRPDVKSSIFALNASLYQRYNKKMSLLPSISLNANLGQILFAPQQGLGDIVWQIAGSLAMPLLNRESLTQDYIIAKENTKQAFYTLQNTINTAISEIENATKNISITNESFQNTRESYEVNKNTFEIMESKYNQQLIDEVSKLEYANTYLQSKNNLLTAHLSENQAAIALYKAFGGDFNPDELKDGELQNMKVPKEIKTDKKDSANDL